MSLNESVKNNVSNSIISEFEQLGILSKTGTEESSTAKLVRSIVGHILEAIVDNAEVVVDTATSMGTGNMGAPVISNLQRRGGGHIQ